MSLLSNMLSRSKHLLFLVSSNFMAEVTVHSDFGAQEINSVTVSIFSLSIYHEVMGLET